MTDKGKKIVIGAGIAGLGYLALRALQARAAPLCTEGETRCVGYDLHTCIGGEWVLTEENATECGYVPPAGEATLQVTCTPIIGTVYLNGEYKGFAPPPITLELSPGTYTITFGEIEDYITPDPIVVTLYDGDVVAKAGMYEYSPPPPGDAGFSIVVVDEASGIKLSNVRVTLYDSSGTVSYGEKLTESDGEARWRNLAPDSYMLRLTKYGYAEASVLVTATVAYPLHQIEMMAEVVPQTATLRVYSGGVGGWQAGYRVYMGGEWITTTGLWGQAIKSGLPLGSHIFSVSPPGGETEVLHHFFTNSLGVRVESNTTTIVGNLTEGENVLSIAMR